MIGIGSLVQTSLSPLFYYHVLDQHFSRIYVRTIVDEKLVLYGLKEEYPKICIRELIEFNGH